MLGTLAKRWTLSITTETGAQYDENIQITGKDCDHSVLDPLWRLEEKPGN
jgi:hypothetical protein